jgi:STE24 endopeptidase
MRLRAWFWDEGKGFLVGLVLAGTVAELLYFIMREAPQHWWLIAWAAFLGLFVLLAQLAPVVLFPIFYKFAPLENDELKERLVRLGERAGTRVRGVYQWKLSEKSKKANAALTGLGNTRRIILADTLLENYSTDEIEAVLAHELVTTCTAISSKHPVQAALRLSDSGANLVALRGDRMHMLRPCPILPIFRH